MQYLKTKTMRLTRILEAESEAKRFLDRIKKVKESEINGENFNGKLKETHTITSKETGALKRSSMDLSRALADLRNDTW